MFTSFLKNTSAVCGLLITISIDSLNRLWLLLQCLFVCMSCFTVNVEKVKQHRAKKPWHDKPATNWLTGCHVEPTQQCTVEVVTVRWHHLAFQVSSLYLITYDRTAPFGGIQTARSSRGMREKLTTQWTVQIILIAPNSRWLDQSHFSIVKTHFLVLFLPIYSFYVFELLASLLTKTSNTPWNLWGRAMVLSLWLMACNVYRSHFLSWLITALQVFRYVVIQLQS